MNVRPPVSLILGLVKGFLSVDRGFDEASLLSTVRVDMAKQSFLERFAKEFDDGRLIMIACYEDLEAKVNWTSLVIGGTTKENVNSLIKQVEERSVLAKILDSI